MNGVFVVGGGPAGLAAAIAARLKGFDVTLADSARPPIDKACGEGLMPDAIPALARLGVHIDAFPITGISFRGDGAAVDADFSRGRGMGIRRTRLHQLLADRAAEVGVNLQWGTPVADLSKIQSRWIIGADGQNSRVRHWAGLDRARRDSRRFGFRRHYRIAPWSSRVEVHWMDGCQIYVTPIACDEVGVAVLTRDQHLRVDQVLDQLPQLRNSAPTSTERGAVTASRQLRRVFRDRTALIGDASGSVDAITGEGLSLSFHQALALADALAAGDLEAYQSEHRRLVRRRALMARMLLALDRSPWLRRRALRFFAGNPAVFRKLLALHTRDDARRPETILELSRISHSEPTR